MISKSKIDEIAKLYGRHSSWAVWNPDDPLDTSVILQDLDMLRTDVVMVGLNVSADITNSGDFANFHSGPNDRWLSFAFNESRFRGAYITDILKDEVDVSSVNVMSRIRSGKINIESHVAQFKKEMTVIGANADTLFLVFGKGAQFLFTNYLPNNFPRVVPCEHFASTHKPKVEWRREIWQAIDET